MQNTESNCPCVDCNYHPIMTRHSKQIVAYFSQSAVHCKFPTHIDTVVVWVNHCMQNTMSNAMNTMSNEPCVGAEEQAIHPTSANCEHEILHMHNATLFTLPQANLL